MSAKPAVELENARVRLGGAEVLRGVDAVFETATLVGVLGPNGAGKSTLLRAAAGLIPLESGEARLHGKPLRGRSRREIAREVNLLPQSVSLTFAFRAREIVAMGRHAHRGRFEGWTRHDHEAVEWAMDAADVTAFADRFVTELSGGERQRVLIARSLATEAPVLLLDEPTTSVDIRHALEIMALLDRFADEGKTVVTALHDLNLARRACDQVLLLREGRVVAAGPPAEALCPGHIESVFGVHAEPLPNDRGLWFSLPGEGEG